MSVMRDPYTVLGVNRKASHEDVKSAFRGLAKQYHPDVAGDSDLVANTFREINAAYDILGDNTKRVRFDHGEIDASGMEIMRRQNSRAANARAQREARNERPSAADIWAARARAGGDRSRPNKNHGEDFKAYSWGRQDGTRKEPDQQDPAPRGPNKDDKEARPRDADKAHRPRADEVFNDLFSGLKSKAQAAAKPDPTLQAEPQAAPEARTDARETAKPADSCYNLSISFEEAARGTSRRVKLPNGKRLDVKIPVGVKSGQQIRLKGQGKTAGKIDGDAILEINVEPHRHFTCEGDDIYLTLPISVDEAVLGAKVMAPTLDGPVAMTIPPGANADTTLRLKGRGLPKEKTGAEQLYGDQYVTLKIVLPAETDADFKTMVEKWAARNAYDVRSDFMF